MDIINILKQLNSTNINFENLIKLASNLFDNKKTEENFTPPPTDTSMNNPYWSLPDYSKNTTQPAKEPTNTNKNYAQNAGFAPKENTENNNSNFIELLKIALPLITRQKEKSQNTVSSQHFDSEILKLKKTK